MRAGPALPECLYAPILLTSVVSCLPRSRAERMIRDRRETAACGPPGDLYGRKRERGLSCALIAAHDPEIRTLLDQGFEFVTNTFKAGE